MIHARYEDAFRSLTSDELTCAVESLARQRPIIYELEDFLSGQELLDLCRAEHISQAEVIMSMARDLRPAAVSAVERLVGRPMDRRSPTQVEQERHAVVCAARPAPPPPTERVVATSQADARVITLLVPANPKRAGTSAHTKYALYRTGMTVGEFLRAGGTRGDLTWDAQRSYIEVA